MTTIRIEAGSDAFDFLARVFAESNSLYRVSIKVRPEGIEIKPNETSWSPTLSTTERKRS